MKDIVVNVHEKRGYFSITYYKATSREEYKKNKRVLGHYDIQKSDIKDVNDFLRKIKHFYIENLSGKELIFVK